MLKEELKKRAQSMVRIPEHFQPLIEEYFEKENGEGEAMFSWTDEHQEEGISISLDTSGNLISLAIEQNDDKDDSYSISKEERKQYAEQFLLQHYPDALDRLNQSKTDVRTYVYRFYYEQIVAGLPIPHAGCQIDVNNQGTIVRFKYYGIKDIPVAPTRLITKDSLIQHVEDNLEFKLMITNLYKAIHNVEKDGPRLVYVPSSFCFEYHADILTPTSTRTEFEEATEDYVNLPVPSSIGREHLSVEEAIGITDDLEVIREVDMGDETGIVWRKHEWKSDEKDLSVNGFFKRQTEDTVKAFISKETGKVRSFLWFKERPGNLNLSHEVCLEKAVAFLHRIIPDYSRYIRLMVRESEEEVDDTSESVSFSFQIQNGHGIPIDSEIVLVVVSKSTGHIEHYIGPSFEIEQLRQISATPVISSKRAKEILIQNLDFELTWRHTYESDSEAYILVYKGCDRFVSTPIQYIDALGGGVIRSI